MRQAVHDFITLQETLGRTEQTLKAYEQRLRQFRLYLKGKKVTRLCDITIQHVRGYHDILIKRNLKNDSRAAYLGTISNFLEWAYANSMILTDIAKRMEIPEPSKSLPPTPLTLDDIRELFAIASATRIWGKRTRAILEVFYATGVRKSELIGLNVGDLDAGACTLLVHGKGQKDRIVPIHEEAVKAVLGYWQTRGRLKKKSPMFCGAFGSSGKKRIEISGITTLFQRLQKKFKKHIHPHLFRHTFACHLLQGGADVRYVQELLGHENTETTGRYLGLVKEDLKLEYDRAVEVILGR